MEIIPCLEKDLGIQCLAKVPYRFHRKLRAVSKSWNALLSCEHFYKERQRNGECEEGVVSLQLTKFTETDFNVIIYYPIGHWWEILPGIPEEFELDYTEYHRCVFVRSKHQLVVVGLFNRRTEIEGVLIFDFLSRKWRLGADMPRNRFEFACAASPTEGLVYIAGGYNGLYTEEWSPYQLEAFVYNVEENK
ncbi:F-box/kelch-repeat protein At2g44130-like [Cryptomeria japonica]|uniref:F-box/kelch-repeat protein At2g44130-like n=1 Tax=Cryptomeria japonica TaxID=3369 RepID=UPI0027DA7156|nr:F-box/kelch-repeat protein At2g44130-like [Cryptomeria japonica]